MWPTLCRILCLGWVGWVGWVRWVVVQVLSALNPVDPLHNCMFDNKLCLPNVFAKNYFATARKAPEVGNIICIFL